MRNKLTIFIVVLFLNISNIVQASELELFAPIPAVFLASKQNQRHLPQDATLKARLEEKRLKACSKYDPLVASKPRSIKVESEIFSEVFSLSSRGAGWESMPYSRKPKAMPKSKRK